MEMREDSFGELRRRAAGKDDAMGGCLLSAPSRVNLASGEIRGDVEMSMAQL